jgi:drug/metabolite transporter (DMT)-like permease
MFLVRNAYYFKSNTHHESRITHFMNFRSSNLTYGFIIFGAALWGTIGLYVDELSAAGFTALQIVTLRVVCAAIMLVIFLAVKNPGLLKIDFRDSVSFIGTGIFSIVFFSWCYFTAIEEVSLSVAVILLYTGPAFVAILSRIFFKEPLASLKVSALLLTLIGCAFVTGAVPVGGQNISLYGLLVGLGSGFGYALYSIFGKHALKKYEPMTVITYTFLFAAGVMLPVNGPTIDVSQLNSLRIWVIILGLGFFPTALAYWLYTTGLSKIESSRASITATVEPLVAVLIGVVIFNEMLTFYQLLGMLFILISVVLIQKKSHI